MEPFRRAEGQEPHEVEMRLLLPSTPPAVQNRGDTPEPSSPVASTGFEQKSAQPAGKSEIAPNMRFTNLSSRSYLGTFRPPLVLHCDSSYFLCSLRDRTLSLEPLL